MATVMTQVDADRKRHLDRLPAAIANAAGPWSRAVKGHDSAIADREAADQQHPDFVNPPAMQRVGYYMRLAVYPANFFAELTAGAATAMYIARALLNVGDDYMWIPPFVFASVVLATEMFVAHTREGDFDELGRAPVGWTAAAVVILVTLVGLQATSQLVDAIKPIIDGESRRLVSDLEWFELARIGFFCALLGVLHAAVLFGGRAQENALAYGVFRTNRRMTGIRVWLHDSAQRAAMEDFSKLVTAYNTYREAHVARGFDPGPMPAFDAATRAMLTRMTQQTQAAAAAVPPPPPANTSSGTPISPVAAQSVGPATSVDEGTQSAEEAASHDAGLEGENAYLRGILAARTRNEDGEVRPVR
jgi:hypothetical protein